MNTEKDEKHYQRYQKAGHHLGDIAARLSVMLGATDTAGLLIATAMTVMAADDGPSDIPGYLRHMADGLERGKPDYGTLN